MKKKYYLFEMKTSTLNIVSLIILTIMTILTQYLLKGQTIDIEIEVRTLGLSLILMIPYFILHELLHSLSYVLHGANFKHITYGMHIEKGILCCLCKERINKRNILISLMYPFIFIGVITYIIGIVMNNYLLILLSIINISGCSGDLMMFFSLSQLKNIEYSEYDNPLAFGLYTNEDLSHKKMFGLKYIGTQDTLEIKDLRRVVISKASILAWIVLVILGVINLFV